ncbi:MAG: L,D-transpeptidase Cds6 family protein, partial [Burkholderiaceae bacterium]
PPEAPYFPPGHIQIASPSREADAAASQSEPPSKPENREEKVAPVVTSKEQTPDQEPQMLSKGLTGSEVRAALTAWRLAWESRDVANYMRFYHADFAGRENFERQKNSVMTRARSIEVAVENVEVTEESGRVRAVFLQTYRSDTYQSKDIKTQVWVAGSQGPQIVSEFIRTRRDPAVE